LLGYLGGGLVDTLFGVEVAFVGEEEDLDVLVCVGLYLIDPESVDVSERGLRIMKRGWGYGVCAVVDHDDGVSAFVVGAGDGTEPLLAGGVPLR
jgi:hypothetical protein